MYIRKGGENVEVQLKPWGNSQGIRISKELLAIAGFETDENLCIEATSGQLVIKKQFKHQTLAERAEKFGGELNLSTELDWDEPSGNEVW